VVFDGVSSNENSSSYIKLFKKKIRQNISLQKRDNDVNMFNSLFYQIHQNLLSEGLDGQSTLSVLYISKTSSTRKFLNIGDSRIYSFNNKYIEKITADDSIPNKNILTKYLGSSYLIFDDFKLNDILDFEKNFLICTDGFYSLMQKELKCYFETINFKYLINIKKKLSYLQKNKNNDDSTYILIKK
jgi:serine/threonine protein phosphatase PrpC